MRLDIYDDNNENIVDKIINFSNLTLEQTNQLTIDKELSINDDKNLLVIKERILKAQKNKEKVFVAGDYDADGVMATSIIKDLLDYLNIENGYYIPNRFKEGYGLSANTIELIYQKGYTLVITVDNGVKAYKAIELCNKYNIDIIVTDHHTIDEPINVYSLLHPTLMDRQFADLCGAGVALQISRMFYENKKHVILAMIATIGDIMPVFNENRIIIKKGLQYLNEGFDYKQVSILVNKDKINERDISFNIVPKINSFGRLEHVNVNKLVEYFTNTNMDYILKFKDIIINKNEERKSISKHMLDRAVENINKDDSFIILYDDDYDEGMCGLVAGSICNKYKKPTIVLSYKNNVYKGSGRSCNDFNLYDNLLEFKDLFIAFGGHAKACGLSIAKENLKSFIDKIKNLNVDVTDSVHSVIKLSLKDITLTNIEQINRLRPFGKDFELPLFYIENNDPIQFLKVKDKYPKWTLQLNPKIEAICFDQEIDINKNYLVFEPTINQFNGKSNISLLVKNIV